MFLPGSGKRGPATPVRRLARKRQPGYTPFEPPRSLLRVRVLIPRRTPASSEAGIKITCPTVSAENRSVTPRIALATTSPPTEVSGFCLFFNPPMVLALISLRFPCLPGSEREYLVIAVVHDDPHLDFVVAGVRSTEFLGVVAVLPARMSTIPSVNRGAEWILNETQVVASGRFPERGPGTLRETLRGKQARHKKRARQYNQPRGEKLSNRCHVGLPLPTRAAVVAIYQAVCQLASKLRNFFCAAVWAPVTRFPHALPICAPTR